MYTQSLNGQWQFRQAGTQEWLCATVPGGVHTDLLALERIPDPFQGMAENDVQWVAESDWEYSLSFIADTPLLAEERVFLVCDGLDTVAEVQLNGQVLGQTDNMFRRYRWEVKALLRPGENEMGIIFRSPVRTAAEMAARRPLPNWSMGIPNGPQLRKAPSHYGWDWGPHVPAIGIWRGIRLEGASIARMDNVHIRQVHEAGSVTLNVAATCEVWDDQPLTLAVKVTAPDGQVLTADAPLPDGQGAAAVPINQPQLWWPNGLGAQPLYKMEVLLNAGKRRLDRLTYQVGLRTLELRREHDAWGRSFTFVVNGVPIFAKGSNWIPADSFPTRMTRERYEALLGAAAAANHNMVRVWGGGYYEDEAFYDLCDRFGLLVWQDFMFACNTYPLGDERYLETVHGEVIDNVRRLRHRACLALWSGNNEIEVMRPFLSVQEPAKSIFETVDRFFYGTLAAWVAAEDPDRPYWPSSPSSGDPALNANDETTGDAHLWEVWHGMKPFSHYRRQHHRFVSEFGFESLPSMRTIAAYAAPEEWELLSPTMVHHQRSAGGNEKMIAYMAERFALPKSFPDLVYMTQILQAEGIRMGVEHWRRERERTGGALYWQLNDCWPVASWSSIDYYGRWKALHYASRRFYAPVLLSIEDDGPRMGIFITNDLPTLWHGQVRWSLETFDGQVVQSGQEEVSAAGLKTTPVCALSFEAHYERRRDLVFVCELWQGGERQALQVATMAPEKLLRLPRPVITSDVRVEDDKLVVTLQADALARFVELALVDQDVIWSDNDLDLPAGRPVTVTCPLPEGWTLEQARQALRIRSLTDVETHSVLYGDWQRTVTVVRSAKSPMVMMGLYRVLSKLGIRPRF